MTQVTKGTFGTRLITLLLQTITHFITKATGCKYSSRNHGFQCSSRNHGFQGSINLQNKSPVIKTGAEIPFTRYFYKYQVPEEPEDVLAEVLALDAQADAGLKALMGGE